MLPEILFSHVGIASILTMSKSRRERINYPRDRSRSRSPYNSYYYENSSDSEENRLSRGRDIYRHDTFERSRSKQSPWDDRRIIFVHKNDTDKTHAASSQRYMDENFAIENPSASNYAQKRPTATVSSECFLSEGECSASDIEDNDKAVDSAMRNNEPKDTLNNNPMSHAILAGWKVINDKLPNHRVVDSDVSSHSTRVSVPVHGRNDTKMQKKPAAKQVEDTFASISESLKVHNNDLLNMKSLDCNAQYYRPDNPLWRPYNKHNVGILPVGFKTPKVFDTTLNKNKLGDFETITATLLNISSYMELLIETQGELMKQEFLSDDDVNHLHAIQEALAIASRDMITVNTSLATNFTLLRRDCFLDSKKNLDDRTTQLIRSSSVLPTQLFGPEADDALSTQNQDPTYIIKTVLKESTRNSYSNANKTNSGARGQFRNWRSRDSRVHGFQNKEAQRNFGKRKSAGARESRTQRATATTHSTGGNASKNTQ